jgi:sialate O-acetylesterase
MLHIKRTFASLAMIGLSLCINAEVKLPALLSDHAVLQQDTKVHIWGTASPGEDVTVSILGQTAKTKTSENGKWTVWLKPMKSAAPTEMTVAGTNTIVVKDILIGEVWIGTGQSNMEWFVKQSNNAEQEIANSANPQIRLFKVNHKISDTPLAEATGEWRVCGPEVVGNFSATEYFFGRELYKATKLPMGLIESCWSATPGQSWLSKPALEAVPELKYIFDDWNGVLAKYPEAMKRYTEALDKWKTDSTQKQAQGMKPAAMPREPEGPGSKNAPASLYNGMIAPIAPYTMRGVLWYQGEANAYEKTAFPYRYLLKALITDWRTAWGQGDFPFMVVQLSAFTKHPYWPILRESQLEALKLPNTTLTVTIDIGDSTNAHSKKKQELGYRLSLAARHLAYKEDIEYSGPLYKQAEVEEKHVRIHFEHATGLQANGGGSLTGFTVAGADGKFVPANARVDGQTVVVSNPGIASPVAVRYAWLDWPVCNLINGAGLPASPFRTAQ